MAQDDSRPATGLSRSRTALLGVYAALNDDLRRELVHVGVRFPETLDPVAQLLEAAQWHRDERDRPRIHRLQLAFAAMAVLGRRPPPPPPERMRDLRPVAEELIDTKAPVDDAIAMDLLAALQRAAGPDIPEDERWALVVENVRSQLHSELQAIDRAWCRPELRSVGDEIASRIETGLVVRDPRDLDQLSLAVLPDNWKRCNDFFCDLIRTPGRDMDCPGSTGGNLSAAASHWRGVYEERVGRCPAGWFPDTYLAFTWDRSPTQLVLRYELAPRRGNDRTVLKIDQGYIQVDRLPDTYQVSTVKYLLFDDTFIPGGGQTLGQAACQLGWLDYSVNQFTTCTDELNQMGAGGTTTTSTDPPEAGIDAGLQQVLDRCQAHLLEAAADANTRVGKVVTKVRDGSYTLDDYVADWGRAVTQAVRDGARSLEGQLDLARESLDVATKFARRRGTRS